MISCGCVVVDVDFLLRCIVAVDVREMSYDGIMEVIRTAGRPVKMWFGDGRHPSPTQKQKQKHRSATSAGVGLSDGDPAAAAAAAVPAQQQTPPKVCIINDEFLDLK